jgi:hypothetical protein
MPDQPPITDIPAGPSLNSFHDYPNNHMATTFYPHPPQQQQQQQPQQLLPQPTPAALTQPAPFITKPPPLDTARSATQSSLRELLALRRQQLMVVQTNGVHHASSPPQAPFSTGMNGTGLGVGVGWMGAKGQQAMVEERVRAQTGLVLRELEGLQARVGEVLLAAEGGRWRRFLVGGAV